MFKVTAKQALDYLDKNTLTEDEHIRLLSILTRSINAFPIDDIIKLHPDGSTLINGQKLTLEETVNFRQGISALRDNFAFKVLGDQILYEAVKWGVHTGDTKERIIFSKTAIWFISKFKEFIVKFDV